MPSQHPAGRRRGSVGRGARHALGNEQGLALVLTLFVVALVTVLVLEYHFDAIVELDLATNYASDVQAYHLALAGVRFAQVVLQQDDPRVDGPDDAWYKLGMVPACFAPQQLLALATSGGGKGLPTAGRETPRPPDRPLTQVSTGDVGCIRLRITDEESKLPINALLPSPGAGPPPAGANPAPDPTWLAIFQAFFTSFHLDPEVSEALLDWMDADDTPRSAGGAERAYYAQLPVPYTPPNRPMRTPGELRLVKGLDTPVAWATLFPGSSPDAVADLDLGSNAYLTTFVGATPPSQTPTQGTPSSQTPAQVNLNTAPPEVLTALIAGVQPGNSAAVTTVQDIVARRQEKQFTTLQEAVENGTLRAALGKVAAVNSMYFRIESVGVVGLVQKKIVAVLKRAPAPAPPLTPSPLPLLYWKVE